MISPPPHLEPGRLDKTLEHIANEMKKKNSKFLSPRTSDLVDEVIADHATADAEDGKAQALTEQ